MPRLYMVDGVLVEAPLHLEEASAENRASHPVAIPEGPAVLGSVGSGELVTAVNPRDTREQLYRQILDHTDGTPAAREWAREKADNACRNWDRGVRTGQIPKP